MRGFVLAAGYGKRLLPLTRMVPKPLMPVGSVPLIGYSLRLLAHHGITEVGVNVHHLPKVLREVLGDGSQFGVEITYSEEEEILGTGGGLKRMEEFLAADGTFVVVNSDTILDVDLTAAIELHRERDAVSTMVLREDPAQAAYGQIEIDSSQRIRRILGQGDADEPLQALMFAGVHVMEPRLLSYVPANVETCINRYAYTKALSNGDPLYATVMDGYWADAGTPQRYFAANVDALEQRMHLPHIDPIGGFALTPTRREVEVVRLGEDVQLGADARLIPPVIVGDGTRIGDGATVGPHSAIGPRSTIGKAATVAESVLLTGAKVDAGASCVRNLVGKKAALPVDEPPPGE